MRDERHFCHSEFREESLVSLYSDGQSRPSLRFVWGMTSIFVIPSVGRNLWYLFFGWTESSIPTVSVGDDR